MADLPPGLDPVCTAIWLASDPDGVFRGKLAAQAQTFVGPPKPGITYPEYADVDFNNGDPVFPYLGAEDPICAAIWLGHTDTNKKPAFARICNDLLTAPGVNVGGSPIQATIEFSNRETYTYTS